ncbi:MAG: hypothetical protein ACRDBQ_22085 [Shewanella sp.]
MTLKMTEDIRGRFFVFNGRVFKIKRVNKVTVTTECGEKIEKKFISYRVTGESEVEACEKYAMEIAKKLESAKKELARTGYGSDMDSVYRYERLNILAVSLLNAIMENAK